MVQVRSALLKQEVARARGGPELARRHGQRFHGAAPHALHDGSRHTAVHPLLHGREPAGRRRRVLVPHTLGGRHSGSSARDESQASGDARARTVTNAHSAHTHTVTHARTQAHTHTQAHTQAHTVMQRHRHMHRHMHRHRHRQRHKQAQAPPGTQARIGTHETSYTPSGQQWSRGRRA